MGRYNPKKGWGRGEGEGFCLAWNLGITLIQLILLSFWEKPSISNITQHWGKKETP
jgi:hypothetical protein